MTKAKLQYKTYKLRSFSIPVGEFLAPMTARWQNTHGDAVVVGVERVTQARRVNTHYTDFINTCADR